MSIRKPRFETRKNKNWEQREQTGAPKEFSIIRKRAFETLKGKETFSRLPVAIVRQSMVYIFSGNLTSENVSLAVQINGIFCGVKMRLEAPSPNYILIIEDDRNTATLVATYLEREGYSTAISGDGEQGLEMAVQTRPHLVILDVMLPKLDGWEICRALRRTSDVPILMLTAREEETDRVKGLAMGADDYVVKPFSPRELVERVKAILRRARPPRPETSAKLSHDGLVLDQEKRNVQLNGQPVELTATEYLLLYQLMRSPGRAFSRKELLDCIYPHGESVIDRVIDVHMGKLRQKIGDVSTSPRHIMTVRGYGYRFADDGDE